MDFRHTNNPEPFTEYRKERGQFDDCSVDDAMKKRCEHDFQNGAGRAQLRNKKGNLIGSCEVLADAKRRCDYENDERVFWRRKVRGQRKYEWILA